MRNEGKTKKDDSSCFLVPFLPRSAPLLFFDLLRSEDSEYTIFPLPLRFADRRRWGCHRHVDCFDRLMEEKWPNDTPQSAAAATTTSTLRGATLPLCCCV